MIYTIEQVVQEVANNAKLGKWLSCRYDVSLPDGTTKALGVKAYGKWVQRVELCGMVDGIPEQKTLKALKEKLADLINNMVKYA